MHKVLLTKCIMLLFLLIQLANCERWDGSTLYDLEGEGATFIQQANLWTASQLANPNTKVTTCNGHLILGGYNILSGGKGTYFERTYNNLPSGHNQIRCTLTIVPVDSWDREGGDHCNITLGGQTVEAWAPSYKYSTKNICGNSDWFDLDPIQIRMVVPHTGTSVTLRITRLLDEDNANESAGLRDVVLTFETVDTPSTSFCGITNAPLSQAWCQCTSTQYMYPQQSGSCYDCNPSCKTCTGSAANQCTLCYDGFYLTGTTSGSCHSCHSSCATCSGGNSNQCLTCQPGNYMVNNNTCITACPLPLSITSNGDKVFCETLCPANFAYKGGVCKSFCDSSYQQTILTTIFKACACYSPGASDSDPCYACDSSCASCNGPSANDCLSCPSRSYFVKNSGLNTGACQACDGTCATCSGGNSNQCLTCHPGDDMVNNNTCITTCPVPFYRSSNGVKDFCETPCPANFAYKGGVCKPSCDSSYQQFTLATTLKACICYSPGAGDSDPCYACDSSCASCNGLSANDCLSCPSRSYFVKNSGLDTGACQACDGTCATCSGPSTTDCLTCKAHSYLAKITPISDNGACQACESTCATCSGTASNQCLTCYPNSYLVSNNTCISDCSLPFFKTTDGTIVFCDTPCPGKFAFEDQVCTNTCDPLYYPRILVPALKACICDDFKYSNGSCLATCPAPLVTRIQNAKKFCDYLCAKNEFLYYNGTCQKDCPLPFEPRVEGGMQFCDRGACDSMKITHLKATPTGHYYKVDFLPDTCEPETSVLESFLNNDASIKEVIPEAVFTVTKSKNKIYYFDLKLGASSLKDLALNVILIGLSGKMEIPKKLVPSALVQNLVFSAEQATQGVNLITGSSVIASLTLKNTASAWSFVGFQQFISFLKYINVDYPLQLNLVFMLGGATKFGSVPNPLKIATQQQYNKIQEEDDLLQEQAPPERFYYYDETSFFIINGGSPFLMNMIALAAVFLIILLRKIPKLKTLLEAGDNFLRWNFVLRTFLTSSLPLCVSICLQLRVLSVTEEYFRLNTVFAIVAMVHFIGMSIFVFHILYTTSYEDFNKEENIKKYGTLLDGIKLENNKAKYYNLLILLRAVLLSVVIVFVEAVSVTQILLLILINAGLVIYLFMEIQFKTRRQTIKTRITETLMIPLEICIMLLTKGSMSKDYYEVTAWVACGIILVMFINELIFAITSQIIGIIEGLKKLIVKIKELRAKRKKKNQVANIVEEKPQEQVKLTIAKVDTTSTTTDFPSPTGAEEKNQLLRQEKPQEQSKFTIPKIELLRMIFRRHKVRRPKWKI